MDKFFEAPEPVTPKSKATEDTITHDDKPIGDGGGNGGDQEAAKMTKLFGLLKNMGGTWK